VAPSLSREVRAVQNPALAAMLLWRCASEYSATSDRAGRIPLPLLFLVLPILLHRETAELVAATQKTSGLRKFVEKFQLASHSKTDLLLSIATRAVAMRDLTSRGLGIAVTCHLLAFDNDDASAYTLSDTPAVAGIPQSVRPLLVGAEKLGSWFAQSSLYEISLLLQVSL
jgi:Family of unknown function (DUF6521)